MKNKFFFFLIFLLVVFYFPLISSSDNLEKGIITSDYKISKSLINKTILQGSFLEDYFIVENLKDVPVNFKISVLGDLSSYLEFNQTEFIISSSNTSFLFYRIKGQSTSHIVGSIVFVGDINEKINVELWVVDEPENPSLFVKTNLPKSKFTPIKPLQFDLIVNLLTKSKKEKVNITYSLLDPNNNTIFLGMEEKNISFSFTESKKFNFPKDPVFGDYVLLVSVFSEDFSTSAKSFFELKQFFLFIKLFGFIPLWLLISFFLFLVFVYTTFVLIRKKIKAGKKYTMSVDFSSLPSKSEKTLFFGKIAETNRLAYFDMNNLKTHTIVAGATGGGKSISAQVVVEEALLKNVAVIVFDPTAQWSGMLRKCEDKKMLSYYPKFNLKKTDAKAFPGNVHMVSDARELIDVNKYAQPGQIQIFTLNKLPPKDIDIFVANVIRGIFESDPKENEDLNLLIVFDEVHRLLSKFGGNGEGFLQIERACREFRKWGIGVMLVSQVLSDFMGEIKANINTEIQMRTRDEGDLSRIEAKYGEEFLKSLVKASVGVGLFTNPHYNKGRPYFINFRPILHNTRRLPDEELEKYNDYNSQIEQIEFEIETLEKKKVDVFDLKMELKLVKDKIMTGSFSVVDIYLQGLKPRLEKEWEKLGEKPPKLQKKLADLSEIKKSIEEAKKAREKYIKEEEKSKKTEEASESKKPENIQEKIIAPLTFDNGIMVSSLKEMIDVLPDLDESVFKLVANKNGFSEWTQSVDEGLSKLLDGKKSKQEVLKILQDFVNGKSLNTDSKKEGAKSEKKVEKKSNEEKDIKKKAKK